ncbi:MAG: DUF2961 domain-containing protein [Sedimentisphaerales bacterium]|nr:DUF2961 domain-containing protein [Sedimentisphaerales bacterium]
MRLTITLLTLLALPVLTHAEELTYLDLIERLTDLEHLAVLPALGETCQQWSSWDRASTFDSGTGQYLRWDANGDGTGIIRTEGDRQVFAEMEGPGVIWRIWSAKDGPGHVKMYLDGNEEPAVDIPFSGYFDRKHEPFVYPALVHQVALGLNNYVPIPYQKSCKIVADEDWGRYYHFTYTTFPKGTKLPTFKRDLSDAETKALQKANALLSDCGQDPAGQRNRQVILEKEIVAEPDAFLTVAALDGPRAITAIKVKMDVPEGSEGYDLLRSISLGFHWDGEPWPSVWAPLGDFFGSAPGVNYYRSLPLGMTEDGFYCYWYMPFKQAAIRLKNDSDKSAKIHFEITHAPLSQPIEKLGRFHAKWHRDMYLDPERKIDWTMLKTRGRGRFCGVMLHVWNPRGGWWGEGDEKFFVDGEKFPSTFGTGSEDYFGYAWCNPGLFSNCYHNQTISMGNKGHVSVNRWHIGDNIPFQISFEGSIEKYYSNDRPTLYACTAYFYLAPGQEDGYRPIRIEDRIGYWTDVVAFRIKGALEGEKLKVLGKTGGNPRTQELYNFGENWSEEAHLWWTDAKPGNTLELAVPVKEDGSYNIKTQLTRAVDYGIVQLYLDGKPLGGPIDLFNNGVIPTGQLDLGTHDLKKGQHILKVEILGANPKAVKSYMFGIDYLLLEKQ